MVTQTHITLSKFVDSKYRTVLDNSASQTNLVPFATTLNNTTFVFQLKMSTMLKSAVEHDDIHTKLLINICPCFRNLMCKLMNKFLSHGFLPYAMLLGKIRRNLTCALTYISEFVRL